MFQILLLAFLLIPLAEIYVLLQVGEVVGALPTIFLCVFTAVLGAVLFRLQGLATALRVQQMLERGELPAVELLEGALLLVSGALLLTPGFLTDAVGFACLVPPLRRAAILHFLRRRMAPTTRPGVGDPGAGPRVIEGEYRRDDD